MIYELRIYDVVPNRREALYDRFKNSALRLLAKHGFRIIDMWEPTDGQEKLVYLLSWRDENERAETWHAFRHDPDWQQLKTSTEAEGMMVTRMDYLLLGSLPFTPHRLSDRAA
jgi:heme-degrading monooxygenase HmoA